MGKNGKREQKGFHSIKQANHFSNINFIKLIQDIKQITL